MVGAILGLATLGAVVFAAQGGPATPLLVIATFWGVLGLATAIFDAIDRVPEAVARILVNVGLERHSGYSDVETLVAQGHFAAAAESYRHRSRQPHARVEATIRRARLLAGPLGAPGQAVAELEALRDGPPLTPAEDVYLGLTLVDLHAERMADRGRALVELRRMLDRHPDSPRASELRLRLDHLRREVFPGPETTA